MTRSLDGVWEFFPGEHDLAGLDALEPQTIRVPGLWEAQGHLDLDGVAWYRRRFTLDSIDDYWTLRFGAVMDTADVFLNGVHVGSHEHAFTPFELDVTRTLRPGENVLAVRVDDPPVGHPEHVRMPHGKQGWANHAFPSRPSLYLTYGGIWQPVTLHRHGPIVVRDVFVNSDRDDLVVSLDARNRAPSRERAPIRVATLGREREEEVELKPGERRRLVFGFGATDAPRWSPDDPVLHEAVVEAVGSDRQTIRYGLRTIRVDGRRILVNRDPYRMKSVLVQGFRADALYAEGDREAISAEVVAAKDAGFNTVRLHIKAFDPTYLDLCDELGMFAHCDIPVAEPLAYDELGADTVLARRCVTAAQEQVRRDRNHPSIVLWTAMNEIGERRTEVRLTPEYEAFARTLVGAVRDEDPTRPVIENDWVEPDAARVFASPILTAHWYGRLHADWLEKLERKARGLAHLERPFFVSEFGDWGLPQMPELPEPPFWDTREVWAAALARALWPESVDEFVAATQRYQGLSDRLQAEVFRRHDHIAGYCLTELTDVPHELNGLLDLHRNPKPPAVAEVKRANQRVLPMLELRSLVVAAGEEFRAALHVANDGPALSDVAVEVGGERLRVGELPAHRPTALGELAFTTPEEPGRHDLPLRVTAGGTAVAENVYPLHVVARRPAHEEVRLIGGDATAGALEAVGARIGERGPTIVAEEALDAQATDELRARLARGETVLVLAQPWEASPWYPARLRLKPVETRWGTGFLFTTDGSALAAFPRRSVLAGEDATVHARAILVDIEGRPFPAHPMVVRYNPRYTTGAIVGAHPVGRGRLVFCQFRLAHRALAGDVAARALLVDLVRFAAA